MKYCFLAFTVLVIAFSAFAQFTLPGTIDGSADWGVIIGQVIANPQGLLSASGVALLVFASVQFLKGGYAKQFFKNITDEVQWAIITTLGLVYSALISILIVKNQELSVFIVGLFGSGMAASVFNAAKLLFGRLFPKFFGKTA